MKMSEKSAELAARWIEAWGKMDLEWLRQTLAPDFVHVSPFGRFEDRESYLATVEPMARKSVIELTVKDVIASGNHAVVQFENKTPKGVVESCEWVRVENELIKEIRSFYDSALIREVLSPSASLRQIQSRILLTR
jgi:ketosteroid isomerase-like protein